ncbi:riboflavin biosynthesis protein RibF [Ureaplasma ceti]|uniref:Riboflavin biosynthesis protein n=1 Tax=Ureaplasma ceti TaxID=3119530 RepID=A0ABP9UB95_9BACT
MILNWNKDNLSNLQNCTIDNLVIGFFDGIHKGHQKIFQNLTGKTCVLTFTDMVWKAPFLYPLEERIQQLEQLFYPEHILIFDVMQHNLTAQEFIEQYLQPLKINQIVVGADFKFGKDQKGVEFLQQFYCVKVVSRDDEYASSTIKKYLMQAELQKANEMLVIPYYRVGQVIHNFQISRALNYPTANLRINDKLVTLPDGVYITQTRLQESQYNSTTFIGIPKTFENITTKHFESFLIDYVGPEFYDETIRVTFFEWIDPVKKYPSVAELKSGIQKQVQQTNEYFKSRH